MPACSTPRAALNARLHPQTQESERPGKALRASPGGPGQGRRGHAKGMRIQTARGRPGTACRRGRQRPSPEGCKHTHTHIHAHTHTHAHTRAHTHAHTLARTHACTRTHTHAHTHARTYTRTHAQNSCSPWGRRELDTTEVTWHARVDLQCRVSFSCTARWISYTYTPIHSFLDSVPLQAITEC